MQEEICTYRSERLSFHHSLSPAPDPDHFAMHAHEQYEMLIFLSGRGSFLVEGNEYPLVPDSAMLMRAGESHCLMIRPEVPYERIGIHFDPSLFAGLDPEGDLLKPFRDRRLGSGNRFILPRLADSLKGVLALDQTTPGKEVYLTVVSFLLTALSEAASVMLRDGDERPAPEEVGKHYALIEYVNQNLDRDLSLNGIAGHFYLSKSQLSRLFKRMTGTTLWDYILIKRLLLARALIREGENASVAAARAGFREYSAFYRAYRKRFGASPNRDRALVGREK